MKKRYIFGISIFLIVVAIISFWGYRDLPLDTLREKYANENSRFINIQGMPMHVRTEGNNADTIPLLLLHGTGASLHTWDGWVKEMQSEKRIIRIDLPAFGLTGPTTDRKYSLALYERVIVEMLDSLGIRKVDIAGSSLGGNIAWYIALRSPDRVRKLILVDAVGYPITGSTKPLAFILSGLPVVNKVFTFITPRFIARNTVVNLYADKSKVTDELINRYFDLTLRPGNRQAFLDVSQSLVNRYIEPTGSEGSENFVPENAYLQIPNIKHPTLILWGAEDHFIPESLAHNFHRDLPNDTLVFLPNNGHMPMEESPRESARIAIDFLKR